MPILFTSAPPEDNVVVVSVGRPGVNTTVSLLCICQCGPDNTYTWSTAPDEESEFTEEFGPNVVISEDELVITNVRFSAGRRYKCEVSNSAGRGSNSITLTSMQFSRYTC